MKCDKFDIIFIIIMAGLFLLIILTSNITIRAINNHYCDEMSVTDAFKDDYCKKYIEEKWSK